MCLRDGNCESMCEQWGKCAVSSNGKRFVGTVCVGGGGRAVCALSAMTFFSMSTFISSPAPHSKEADGAE